MRGIVSVLLGGILVLMAACAPAAAPTPTPTKAPATPTPAPKPKAEEPAKPAAPAKPGAVTLIFTSGPTGGTWIPMGATVSEIVKGKYPDIDIQVEPGAALTNMEKIRTDKADLGWVNGTVLIDARAGTGVWKGKQTDKPLYVMNMYPNVFQVVVPQDEGIKDIKGLKGKPVALPPKGNTSLDDAWVNVLALYGMKLTDFSAVNYGSLTENVDVIKNRQAVAAGWTTTVPASFIMDLGSARKVYILSFPDEIIEGMKKINAGNVKHIIPAGTYKDQGHEAEVVTFQSPTLMIAHPRVPEDVVYRMVKALVEGRERFAATTAAMKGVTPAELGKDFGFPYHPGAAKYYKEIGVLK